METSECATIFQNFSVEDVWNGAGKKERQINIKEDKVEAKRRAKSRKPQGTEWVLEQILGWKGQVRTGSVRPGLRLSGG